MSETPRTDPTSIPDNPTDEHIEAAMRYIEVLTGRTLNEPGDSPRMRAWRATAGDHLRNLISAIRGPDLDPDHVERCAARSVPVVVLSVSASREELAELRKRSGPPPECGGPVEWAWVRRVDTDDRPLEPRVIVDTAAGCRVHCDWLLTHIGRIEVPRRRVFDTIEPLADARRAVRLENLSLREARLEQRRSWWRFWL